VEEEVAMATEVHPALLPVETGHEVRCWLYHDAAGNLMPRPDATVSAPVGGSEASGA
jgi:hypothetical protein